MIYQMIPLFFDLYTTKTFHQMNLIMTYGKLVTERINGKRASTPTLPTPKQAQEVTVSRKITKSNHPTLIFNDNPVYQVALQKHLGMFLDCKLNFEEHLKTIVNKINKAYFVNFRISYQENCYSQYINPLSDHTLTVATLFTIKVIILLSIKDWSHFNTMRR